MAPKILLTGVSGYLGGTLLNEWQKSGPKIHGTITALVRNNEQAKEVVKYGVEPLAISLKDEDAIVKALVDRGITIVLYLIEIYWLESQLYFIKSLTETNGTKQLADTAGCPIDQLICDNDPDLFDIQSEQELRTAFKTNCAIIDEGEKRGVRVYLFSPCIVYGKGTRFRNKISIQTVDLLNAFKHLGHAYDIQEGNPKWAVCSFENTTSPYFFLLQRMLNEEEIPYDKQGYYLSSPGQLAWKDIYAAFAKALYKKRVIDSPQLTPADDEILERMEPALGVEGKASVIGKIGGISTYSPRHAEEIGWRPKHLPEHILENDVVDREVETILPLMNDSLRKVR